jgi:hypothetical protein
MPALKRAVALEQVYDVAIPVTEHLHFDVPRAQDVFLDQDPLVTKRGSGLPLAADQRVCEVLCHVDTPHPFAAAARDGLYQNRIADAVGLGLELRG